MATSWAEHIKKVLREKELQGTDGETRSSILPQGLQSTGSVIRPPPGLAPPPGFNPSNLKSDETKSFRKPIQPLDKQIYPTLDFEINKIKALNIFKRRLIHNILKYFRFHQVFDRKRYIERQMYNLFPNWFFQLNVQGQVVDFIPQQPLVIQDNLDYIFKERRAEKKVDFDPKLLTFDPKYIKQITGVTEIIKKVKEYHIYYALKTNAGLYQLIPISKEQHDHLQKLYTGPEDKFEEYLCIILARYKFLGGMNNHLSIPREVYSKIQVDFELFGTPLNTMTTEYCSPFYDVEKYFGSRGSFFNYKLENGKVYGANPPFSADLIEKMAQKLENELGALQRTSVYVTIPQWREDFKGHEIMKQSSFLKEWGKLHREEFPYYHYYKMRYVSAVNSFLVILSTDEECKVSVKDVKEVWPNGPRVSPPKYNKNSVSPFGDDLDSDSDFQGSFDEE